jgi:hypothetical protein
VGWYTYLAASDEGLRVRQRTRQREDWGAKRKVRATLPPCLPVAPTMAMMFLLDAGILSTGSELVGPFWEFQ